MKNMAIAMKILFISKYLIYSSLNTIYDFHLYSTWTLLNSNLNFQDALQDIQNEFKIHRELENNAETTNCSLDMGTH